MSTSTVCANRAQPDRPYPPTPAAYRQRTSKAYRSTASRSDSPSSRCNTITVATTDGGTDRRPDSVNRSANNSSGNNRSRSRAQEPVDRVLRQRLLAEPGHVVEQVDLTISTPQRHPEILPRPAAQQGDRHAKDTSHLGRRLDPACGGSPRACCRSRTRGACRERIRWRERSGPKRAKFDLRREYRIAFFVALQTAIDCHVLKNAEMQQLGNCLGMP